MMMWFLDIKCNHNFLHLIPNLNKFCFHNPFSSINLVIIVCTSPNFKKNIWSNSILMMGPNGPRIDLFLFLWIYLCGLSLILSLPKNFAPPNIMALLEEPQFSTKTSHWLILKPNFKWWSIWIDKDLGPFLAAQIYQVITSSNHVSSLMDTTMVLNSRASIFQIHFSY